MNERDEDLRARFAELRSHERRRTPSVDAIVGAPRARWRPARLVAAAAVVVALGAGVFLLLPQGAHSEGASWLANWTSPTAALLSVPGSDLVREVPSVSKSVITLEEQ